MTKYIFVTGGVVSGLGKGITAASLGRLLKARGLKVAAQKLDPYINVDPGTMSPYQHGEVYVTEDGAETDLDLGHYERFIDEDLNKYSNLTTGKVYWNVLNKERRGEYLGETVQVIPHITNEIKDFIYSVGSKTNADVVITEVGGTTGDIESQPFLEAIRQVGLEVGRENALYIHVTLVPYLHGSEEHKTKPTQHSVKELRSFGIQPDIIVLRSDHHIDDAIRGKIASFCDVDTDCVFTNEDCASIYDVPQLLAEQDFDLRICERLGLDPRERDMSEWNEFLRKQNHANHHADKVKIAVVGKYTQLPDAYLSVIEALHHAGVFYDRHVDVQLVDGESLDEQNVSEVLGDASGILVPGGYRVYHAVAHVVFQDHLAGVVQRGTHRRQLDEHLRAVVPFLHHPLHLFQMADGAGQPVQYGLLIFVDMAVAVGNAMGMEIGMVMLVVVVMGVAAFVGVVGHRLVPLSRVKHTFYSIPFFCVFRKPSRGISAQK